MPPRQTSRAASATQTAANLVSSTAAGTGFRCPYVIGFTGEAELLMRLSDVRPASV